jgi:hypothetical protein
MPIRIAALLLALSSTTALAGSPDNDAVKAQLTRLNPGVTIGATTRPPTDLETQPAAAVRGATAPDPLPVDPRAVAAALQVRPEMIQTTVPLHVGANASARLPDGTRATLHAYASPYLSNGVAMGPRTRVSIRFESIPAGKTGFVRCGVTNPYPAPTEIFFMPPDMSAAWRALIHTKPGGTGVTWLQQMFIGGTDGTDTLELSTTETATFVGCTITQVK